MLWQELHISSRQLGVLGPRDTRCDFAFHFNHIFVAERVRDGRQLGILLRAKNDLGQSFAIAQIDENDAAMIAPDMHPAREFRDTADVGGT